MTAITSPRCRTGIACRRIQLRGASSGGSSETTRSSSQARRNSRNSGSATTALTRSSTNAVTPVVGRAWAAQMSRPGSVGTHNNRSEKDRSASSCHSETTACRWATAAPEMLEWSARTSESVDME